MADSKEKLFSDFPGVSTEAWMEKITADLKGADFEKKLVWRTNEGFKVKPFYRQEDLQDLKTVEGLPGQFPYIRGNKKDNNSWYVRQEINVTDAKEANAKALDILNRGVDSIGFHLSKKDLSLEYLETLLKDIYVECVPEPSSPVGRLPMSGPNITMPATSMRKQESTSPRRSRPRSTVSLPPMSAMSATPRSG